MKISREQFELILKKVGRATREKLSMNANENHRLRFLLDEFIRSGGIIKKTLKNKTNEKASHNEGVEGSN